MKKYAPEQCVYLDESGIDDNETYVYAWGPKGQRVYDMKRGSRSQCLTIIAALNQGKIIAPFVFEGTCNREVMEAYLVEQLVPVLCAGQVVVCDNASFHKGGKIKQIIEDAGCILVYLPPYSPDFNPIEKCWYPTKNTMRKHLQESDGDLFGAAIKTFENR